MRIFALVSLLALAACDTVAVFPPEGAIVVNGFSLVTDRTVYDNGSDVTLTLRNDGPVQGEMGVLGCAILEQRTEAGWTAALDRNDRVCILMMVGVSPGQEIVAVADLDGVRDGTYRFVQPVSGMRVATASFTVR